MTFAPHYRVTMNGTLGGGAFSAPVETFSMGINMSTAFLPGSALDNDVFWADVRNDCVAFFSRPTTHIHSQATLHEIKCAAIGANGKYTRDPFIFTANAAGGDSSNNLHPPQVALAVSLGTARRGPTGRGRFYLPLPAIAVDAATLELSDGQRDDVAHSVQTFLNALNNAPGLDAGLSPRVIVASTKGYNSTVTNVRVGKAFDTIRTRRQALTENYSTPLGVG